MKHFIRIVMEKQALSNNLNEGVLLNANLYESEQGATIFEFALPRQLNKTEADMFAEKVSNYMFDKGFDDFDIEISTNESVNIAEETYDGDDFYEQYGVMWFNEDTALDEAKYQGHSVPLGKPMQGDVKKFKVYVKKPNGNIVKVNFGDPNMRIKKSNPARRRSFRARHNCDNPGPRTKARYWSCRKW